jgi:plasmid maintenance system antidote protein VapI
MTPAEISVAIRELLKLGLTVRDVAELFRVHPRAIVAIITG